MFCFPHHDHHSSTRILHSFRSHRSLRASAAQQHHNQLPSEDSDDSFDNMHLPHFHHHNHRHQRQPSDAPTMSSSATRSSYESSRPSTSGGRSDDSCSSIEWNPLGLHPPLAPAPRLHQQRSLQSFNQHLQQLQQTTAPVSVVSPAPSRQPSHGHSRSAPPALVIYDGFDFGFGEKSASSTPSSSGPSTPGFAGSRRPCPPGGMDGPDFFIKRGGWKRRGIVFSSGEGSPSDEGSCDEVFDLEC